MPSKGKKPRGSIRQRGNSFQVSVYAGYDPVTGRRLYLTDSTDTAEAAEEVRKKLVAQVEAERHARTRATLSRGLRDWLSTTELEASTRKTYEMYIRVYIEPALGDQPMERIRPRMLEELYADLRRCRKRCSGEPFIEHRETGEHECRVVKHKRPPGKPPAGGHRNHDCSQMNCTVVECLPHVCKPLGKASVIKIHHIISGTFAAAKRWEWLDTNPADVARPPQQPAPEPNPPTIEEVGKIVTAAWDQDETWGTLVWVVMVTGLRRGELLPLRWQHVDFEKATLAVRHSKTGRLRYVALDPATVDVLREHYDRYVKVLEKLEKSPSGNAYLFSYEPEGTRPYNKDWVTHRYTKMCRELGIETHLHALRHYAATELLTAGIDVRTVSGRLGHGSGATTLKYYAAWVHQADQRAAALLGSQHSIPRSGRERSS